MRVYAVVKGEYIEDKGTRYPKLWVVEREVRQNKVGRGKQMFIQGKFRKVDEDIAVRLDRKPRGATEVGVEETKYIWQKGKVS